jgi:hypothetical protein
MSSRFAVVRFPPACFGHPDAEYPGAANALSKVAKFTKRHMEILQGECQNIYQPQRSFDSTCLRVPNIVYVLFAGRFR